VTFVIPMDAHSPSAKLEPGEDVDRPGELKVEAVLSDHDAERILSIIVACKVETSEKQFVTHLVEQELALAGPHANDLWQRIVTGVERKLISQVYSDCAGVKTRAAARLGIDRNTLHKKLRQYDLLDDEPEAPENGQSDSTS
jgi:DNA-binding protein Fis